MDKDLQPKIVADNGVSGAEVNAPAGTSLEDKHSDGAYNVTIAVGDLSISRNQNNGFRRGHNEADARGGAGSEHLKDLQTKGVATVSSTNDGKASTLEQNKAMLSQAWKIDMPLPCTKKLLILDVNGFLVAQHKKSDKKIPSGVKQQKFGHSKMSKRPFCDSFLDFCFQNFYVGIWSAMKEANVHKALNFICKGVKDKFVFVMHQEDCTDTGFRNPKKRQQPLFLKELRKVWSTFRPGEFNQTNTLLIDDTPSKALRNPPCSAIFPDPYSYNKDDNFLAGQLQNFLEGLRDAVDVQDFVHRHPIGAQVIMPGCLHWEIYKKVLESDVSVNLKDVVVPGNAE